MTIQYDNCSQCGVETIEGSSHRGDSFCSSECETKFKSDPLNLIEVYDVLLSGYQVHRLSTEMSREGRALVSMTQQELYEYYLWKKCQENI